MISSEVAKSLTKRPNNQIGGTQGQNDFLEYSLEWQRQRDAKIEQKRKE